MPDTTAASSFPHLLAPLRLRSTVLPNRMAMGAMHTRLETLDRPLDRLAAFYAARARGGIGLMLTGGYAPVPEGVMNEGGLVLDHPDQLDEHRRITTAVRAAGGHIALQILHAGRYARVPTCVAPSPGRARINIHAPRALDTAEVWRTIAAYARTAALAEQAGYVGVEIMGSEGYLINEFTSALTNRRDDAFGGDAERRLRFPLEIVRAVRAQVGAGFVVIYRISSIDLMDGGMTATEIAGFAQQIEAAGADLINVGVGWHESAVPTIAAAVPRAAWVAAARNIRQAVGIPVMASNRISTPEVAEAILASGAADLVSMARPLLADPDFARKVSEGRRNEIAPCIACNQACLDHIFTGRTATCLVNPRAGHEIDFDERPAAVARRIAVVGGGPAGMACALEAARRGHAVTLFEADATLGGQLRLARQVPGKHEFDELLRYFPVALRRAGVDVRVGIRAEADALAAGRYDEIVLATGTTPWRPDDLPGIDHPKVLDYATVLQGRVAVGPRVAILGAGGVGFDVAAFLTLDPHASTDLATFQRAWGVDVTVGQPGGLCPAPPAPAVGGRLVYLFQRSAGSPGRRLGKSTGWILKAQLRQAGVVLVPGASYERIDDDGLHYTVDGQAAVLAVDHVIVCTGQRPQRTLQVALVARGLVPRLIGGAEAAADLDARRAIDQGVRLAAAF
jgi:2,4-dienoyl-CoA reductase (NADPH2)